MSTDPKPSPEVVQPAIKRLLSGDRTECGNSPADAAVAGAIGCALITWHDGCIIEPCADGWFDVLSADRRHYLGNPDRVWVARGSAINHRERANTGMFKDAAAARAALCMVTERPPAPAGDVVAQDRIINTARSNRDTEHAADAKARHAGGGTCC